MTKCGLFTSGRCCLDASTSAPLSCMGVIPITGRCECHLSAWTLCYLSARLFRAGGPRGIVCAHSPYSRPIGTQGGLEERLPAYLVEPLPLAFAPKRGDMLED